MTGSSAELMQTAPVFRDLSDDDRHVLARIGEARLYRKGDSIFREGDRAERLYTVLRGRVKIYKSTPTGKDIILAILGPGAPVGAVAVYHGVPFPASATAFEDAVLMSIPVAAYFDILEKEPGLVRRLLGAMTHRLMELNLRFPELAGGNVEARMARLILKLSGALGRATADRGVLVPMHLSRQEISDFTGTTIETAIRVMSRWGKEGIVETTDDGFVVRDMTALQEIAES